MRSEAEIRERMDGLAKICWTEDTEVAPWLESMRDLLRWVLEPSETQGEGK